MKSWACSANRRNESALPQVGVSAPPLSVLVAIASFPSGTIGAFDADVDPDSGPQILTARWPVRLYRDTTKPPQDPGARRRRRLWRSPARGASRRARRR